MSDDILFNGNILYAGVGNVLRGDDGIGCYITDNLNVPSITAGEHNEKIYFETLKLRPDKVVIFDACDFLGKPGEWRIIEPQLIDDHTVSTHKMPLSVVCRLILEDTETKVYLVGIQPARLDPNSELSSKVKKTADRFIMNILKAQKTLSSNNYNHTTD